MICGLLFAFFGVALSWAGIRGTLDGSIKSEGMSATFNTASPGIVMMICGAVLIGIATTREVNTKRTTVKPIESAETQDVKIYTEETTEEEE
jgi:drug/metabolite transporter (DMT)-like permease